MLLENAAQFTKTDPHLRRLSDARYTHHASIIDELPQTTAGIITLGGGRQIGKTTLLKQWIAKLLSQGVKPEAIAFYSSKLIHDHQNLYKILHAQIQMMPKQGMKYIILDEVTDIIDWDKTIKYLTDIGDFDNTVVVVSGSDLVLMQDARKRFPGRRGKLAKTDFHYYPLSFKEFLILKNCLPSIEEVALRGNQAKLEHLYNAFDEYLIHGDFLTAINEYAVDKSISPATLSIYSESIRDDVLKRNKKEIFLQEIIEAIVKHYLKQVSWDNLVKELSIDHTQTIADYINLLSGMDAVFVRSAIIEDKLKPAPKKRKKLMFADPFIYHAMGHWLTPAIDPFGSQIQPIFQHSIAYSELVEACVTIHFRRFYPTYYIKAEGEVDIAYVDDGQFWPIEVKWSKQLRVKDLKQIQKYNNGKILAKIDTSGQIHGVLIEPLPLGLLRLGD